MKAKIHSVDTNVSNLFFVKIRDKAEKIMMNAII